MITNFSKGFKMDENDYTHCEDCGTKILKGDVRYVGKEVCEYCYDSYLENGDSVDNY